VEQKGGRHVGHVAAVIVAPDCRSMRGEGSQKLPV